MILVRDLQLYILTYYERVVSKMNRDTDKRTGSSHGMEMGEEVR